MAAQTSIVPDIIWNWVIEALATFEQADASTLIGLVKMAPAISGELGKDAKEVVSLRILESLFLQGDESVIDADLGQIGQSKIRFDSSKRCEDVLQQILQQIPENSDKFEKEKWDVRPFLTQKKSKLPKCMLKKLKEAILESSNPLFASLKEKSKLVIANSSENVIPINDDTLDIQDTVAKDDLVFLNPRKDKEKFQGKGLQKADEVAKLVIPNSSENVIPMNDDTLDIQDTVAKDDLVFLNPRKDKENFQEKGSQKADEVAKLVILNSSENVNPVNDDNLDNQDPVAKDDLVFLNPRKDKENFQEKGSQKADEVGNDENLVQDTNDKMVSVDNSMEILDEFKDENVEQNAMDSEPLSKEKNSMEDSLISLCVKCNESGELLACSSDSCPLQVHESCLRFDVTFDENGNFFCPFCVYSNAISEYKEAKRKASKARKDLQSFSSFKVKPSQSKKQSEFKKNEGQNVGKECGSSKGVDLVQGVNCEGPKMSSFNENESHLVACGHVDKHIENVTSQPSTPKRKSKEKESQRSTESSCSRELRKRKAQYTPPRFPLLRRKALPWTKLEEEKLKEGVEKYSNANDKKMPWKEILDFGHNVFNRGRTTIDLKDKWRNMCKGK